MPNLINKAIAQLLPLAPKPLVGIIAKRYVAGETLDEALEEVRHLNQQHARATLDYLGEFITEETEAHETAIAYKEMFRQIKKLGLNSNVSVKLSALGLLLDEDLCLALMKDLCFYATQYKNFIRIDMEDSQCTDATIDLYLKLRKDCPNVGIVLQAYLKRTPDDIARICAADAGHIRLCKGIYIESETIAYKGHERINQAYLDCLEQLFKANAYVAIATHDKALIEGALSLIHTHNKTTEDYEFQMLLGVTESIRSQLIADKHPLRVYVPYGHHWYGYSLRRLKENPAIAGHIIKNILKR